MLAQKWLSTICSKSYNYRHLFIAVYDANNDDAATATLLLLLLLPLSGVEAAFNQKVAAGNLNSQFTDAYADAD